MKAVCDWCLTPVKASDTYNPLRNGIFCSNHCIQKEWLFKKWQNDKYLNWLAKETKNGTPPSR